MHDKAKLEKTVKVLNLFNKAMLWLGILIILVGIFIVVLYRYIY